MTQGGSSVAEVRALLAALVATKPQGRVAECGTAVGEGATAIVGALAPGATFVTVEPDPERFAIARRALAGTRAEVLNGSWQQLLPARAPFDLIFLDGGVSDDTVDLAIDLLAPGGILVKDDLTPGIPVEGDPVREALLRTPRLIGAELLARADMAVIIATRRA